MRKFKVEVTVDLTALVGLTFEVEAKDDMEAEAKAAYLASNKLEGMDSFDLLNLISEAVSNGGSIFSSQSDQQVLEEWVED